MTLLNLLGFVCLSYVALLFLVAFWADRLAERGRGRRFMSSALIYTLSMSIYCTAWTFYGAVGNAARSGLEYVTIYLGPTLVMIAWWWGLRKLVRVGRSQRISSIADLLSSRYGKSNTLAICVTLLAVIGVTPYIALQLQSITLSLSVFAEADGLQSYDQSGTVFWIAAGLAAFVILFGTRNLNANERHHGVVMAVALEALVKIIALIAVGVFVVWGLAGGVSDVLDRIDASDLGRWQVDGSRWVTITVLSAAAFVCLPRMFQVMVVENEDERHLQVAAWAFPLYLLVISVFVVPIAALGLEMLPEGTNPDLFVLSLPMAAGQKGLAVLSFLGGFSSATSMVIVAAMSLSTMVSNHIVMPIWLSAQIGDEGASMSGDVRNIVLMARRLAIAGIMALGYAYYQASGGGDALASIGIVSFSGIAQILPALVGGLFWRGATRLGALAGLLTGFGIWIYTLFLPELGGTFLPPDWLENGPFGISWLHPQALFGIIGLDPIVHSALWSLSLNTAAFCLVSVLTFPTPLERLQGAQFVDVFDHSAGPGGWLGSVAQAEDLLIMSQRILGPEEAQAFFHRECVGQGGPGPLPEPTPRFLEALEKELSASIGSAAAHAMIGQIVGGASVSVDDLLAVADESAQMLEYSARLEAQSQELQLTARKLRETNEQLTELSRQKDEFLSQVSHELRTPMTSVRAFSEILRDTPDLATEDQRRYVSIIHDEAQRLTRLLNDLLDLSVLENGQVSLNLSEGRLSEVLDHSVIAALAGADTQVEIRRDRGREGLLLNTDLDRLAQVFINLIANAEKYCKAKHPVLKIDVFSLGDVVCIDFVDNGAGVPIEKRKVIFEKFSRVTPERAGGSGLGLAISREIMLRLGGDITYVAGHTGARFRVMLPLSPRKT
jgi:Na+/proline symporter/signal transduction histidine kinase